MTTSQTVNLSQYLNERRWKGETLQAIGKRRLDIIPVYGITGIKRQMRGQRLLAMTVAAGLKAVKFRIHVVYM